MYNFFKLNSDVHRHSRPVGQYTLTEIDAAAAAAASGILIWMQKVERKDKTSPIKPEADDFPAASEKEKSFHASE